MTQRLAQIKRRMRKIAAELVSSDPKLVNVGCIWESPLAGEVRATVKGGVIIRMRVVFLRGWIRNGDRKRERERIDEMQWRWRWQETSFRKPRHRVLPWPPRLGWRPFTLSFWSVLALKHVFFLFFIHFCPRLSLELSVTLCFLSSDCSKIVFFEFYFGVLWSFWLGAEPGFKEECDRSRLRCGVCAPEEYFVSVL